MRRATLCDQRHFIVGMAIDITEQQHAEGNLCNSEKSVRRLIDAIAQIVWTANADRDYDYFNRRWYEYTGLNRTLAPVQLAGSHSPRRRAGFRKTMAARVKLATCLSANIGCVTPREIIVGSSDGLATAR